MPNCVVVGGSRGIGRAVALLLGELGTNVVVNGRHADVVDDTVGAITSSGGTAVGFVGAPDNERTATDLIDTCRTQYGGIDALINCAGIPEPTGSSTHIWAPCSTPAVWSRRSWCSSDTAPSSTPDRLPP
ncbi:Putative short chain dehydrogenase/reductase [Mycobacteroides abscessus]|nr:Putative short chain dehydrogenase/reductase [Mycobacteroides abscessus]CPZ29846.1 Putative short chain dehydrogenase/reductase [Mycobacteroides abscessus]